MTSETAPPDRVPRPTSPTGHFAMRFSSTPRGARLARRLTGQRLDAWGIPYDCDTHHGLTLIVAELAANAVRHGRGPGRDFHLSLACDNTTVRIEVTDTRTEGVPVVATPTDLRDTGRGLLLVEHLADRWDWRPRPGGPGKTVWAEYVLPAEGRPAAAPEPLARHDRWTADRRGSHT
ncbi:ATP-binding protein [Streptomyces shenzhenensis]|uniref:ATP-binding protein n=1 Tax=Streptomyces shenzhenensis TaxID=943815 RepID=UPI00215D73D6|nr:ATP-binding protein [Streptomyces shenzhenensis]